MLWPIHPQSPITHISPAHCNEVTDERKGRDNTSGEGLGEGGRLEENNEGGKQGKEE